jgi:hypothetical protein
MPCPARGRRAIYIIEANERRILPFGQDRETAAREGPRPFAPLFRVLVSSAIIVTLMLRNMMANLKKFLTFSEDTVKNNRIFSQKRLTNSKSMV